MIKSLARIKAIEVKRAEKEMEEAIKWALENGYSHADITFHNEKTFNNVKNHVIKKLKKLGYKNIKSGLGVIDFASLYAILVSW